MIIKYNESLQIQRLKQSIETARKSEFYRERLKDIEINSLEDIKKIPFTTKDELREAGCYGLVAVPRTQLVEYHESFGTTGIPVSSWRTENDCRQSTRVITAHGIDFYSDDIVFIRNPYALSSPAHEIQAAAREAGACVVPVSTRSDITSYSRTVNLLHKLQPTIMTCIPIEGFFLAETAKLMGLDPKTDFPVLRAFYCAGELMNEKRRCVLEKIWGIDILMYYGSTEMGTMGSACKHKHIHLYPENYLFEILNPETMENVKPGEKGTLVVTTLAREAQPIFRFNTGDIVEIVEHHFCLCGSKHPILKHYGRYEDRIVINNHVLLFSDLQDIVYSFRATSFWKAFVNENQLEIRIESEDVEQEVDQRLVWKLQEQYDFPFTVTLVKEGDIFEREILLKQSPIGKPTYVVDNLREIKEEDINPFISITNS
jgi:phenylacetate-CoA ligase